MTTGRTSLQVTRGYERTYDGQQRQHVTAESGRAPIAMIDTLAGTAIARLPLVAIDCPDPGALARFYGAMLDWKIDFSAGRASVCPEDGQCIAFHRVADYTPPTWPTQERPKQMHLDMLVDDLDAAEEAVIDLGATKHSDQPGTSYRVFLDPAGHPFCLCLE
ncbi:VOC family protein [Dactylosporangium sp. CA-152071]|uniref:VOC family protein n=1 Tax=Dactylosporangium sp. CA-152071 TaxID=3239933 RepID=UPI003D8E6895